MITIFTTPSCSSCRKAKKWLEEYGIKYHEKNLFVSPITNDDLNLMLKNADNGFEDIISTRSKIFKEHNLNVDDMTISELKKFIIDNPSVLKRPIIVDDKKMQVGYNEEDIRVFVPRKFREALVCPECTKNGNCDYQISLKKYMNDIKAEVQKEL